jgi:hypothetical protein
MIGINQNDITERNRQVRLMRSIYTKAEKVIAWLGPDYNGEARALSLLKRLSDAIEEYPENLEWLRSIPELCNVGDTTMDIKINEAWIQINKLLRRPYWARIWIFQEAILARSLWFMCESEQFELSRNIEIVAATCQAFSSTLLVPNWLKKRLSTMMPHIHWEDWLRIHNLRFSWQRDGPSANNLNSFVLASLRLRATDPRDKKNLHQKIPLKISSHFSE